MKKYFNYSQLLIASHNKGKIAELEELFAPFNINLLSAADFDLPVPEETEASFIDNAMLKARYYGKATDLPALADDSGLCIDVLGGAPGIYSARWAPNEDFKIAIKRVETELAKAGVATSRAHFICALSLLWPEEDDFSNFTGILNGDISFPARGDKGFGYDPIFMPEGYNITLSQMTMEQKNAISHRTKAFEQLINAVFKAQ